MDGKVSKCQEISPLPGRKEDAASWAGAEDAKKAGLSDKKNYI